MMKTRSVTVKKNAVFTLCLIISLTLINVPAHAAEAAQEPNVEAKGAILMEYDTGRVLYERCADDPLPNASTTKIMTAILTIEKCGLQDVVTASKNAAQTPPTKMYLEVGEKQTVETLLYALMLESANDAAVALAEHVSGSVTVFAELMNDKAKELGAYNTEFVTPNGLDSGNHHTTARDMALISRYALKNRDFQKIIGTPYVATPVRGGDYKRHTFVNKDRLLSEFDGALGIKTGYTGGAGHCFVGAAHRNGMTLVSVVLGSGWGDRGKEQKWIDTKTLLNYGFNNYKYVEIAKKDDLVKTAGVLHSKGASISMRLKNSLALPLSDDEKNTVKLVCNLPEEVDAPVTRGEKLGYADVSIEGKHIAKIDIIADRSVERHDFNISMGKILNGWLNMDYKAIYE